MTNWEYLRRKLDKEKIDFKFHDTVRAYMLGWISTNIASKEWEDLVARAIDSCVPKTEVSHG